MTLSLIILLVRASPETRDKAIIYMSNMSKWAVPQGCACICLEICGTKRGIEFGRAPELGYIFSSVLRDHAYADTGTQDGLQRGSVTSQYS